MTLELQNPIPTLSDILTQRRMLTSSALEKASAEVSSGGLSDYYFENTPDPGGYDLVTQKLSGLQAYQQQNAKPILQLKEMSITIDKLADVASSLAARLSYVRTNGPSADTNFSDFLKETLSDLALSLNRSSGSAYLFAGAAGNQKPIDVTALTPLPSGAAADFGYFKGSTEPVTVSTSSITTETIDVTAGDPAIEGLLRVIRISQSGNIANPRDPAFTSALDLLNNTVIPGISSLVSRLGMHTQNINNKNAELTSLINVYVSQAKQLGFRSPEQAINAEAGLTNLKKLQDENMMVEMRRLNDFLSTIKV